jgi:hypothetical protein
VARWGIGTFGMTRAHQLESEIGAETHLISDPHKLRATGRDSLVVDEGSVAAVQVVNMNDSGGPYLDCRVLRTQGG